MAYPTVGIGGPTNFTTVDCHKQVRAWRLLRSILELLIPTCTKHELKEDQDLLHHYSYNHHYQNPSLTLPTTITGAIFGSRNGKVNFCIQKNPKSTNPFLLLELAIPTTSLAREMCGGSLRIVLECSTAPGNGSTRLENESTLLAMPVWTMCCNGKKVGFAVKRQPSRAHSEVLHRMESVSVGAGIVSGKEQEDIMYLRGHFTRVGGGSGLSETFHLIDPDGNVGQELSILFLRSK